MPSFVTVTIWTEVDSSSTGVSSIHYIVGISTREPGLTFFAIPFYDLELIAYGQGPVNHILVSFSSFVLHEQTILGQVSNIPYINTHQVVVLLNLSYLYIDATLVPSFVTVTIWTEVDSSSTGVSSIHYIVGISTREPGLTFFAIPFYDLELIAYGQGPVNHILVSFSSFVLHEQTILGQVSNIPYINTHQVVVMLNRMSLYIDIIVVPIITTVFERTEVDSGRTCVSSINNIVIVRAIRIPDLTISAIPFYDLEFIALLQGPIDHVLYSFSFLVENKFTFLGQSLDIPHIDTDQVVVLLYYRNVNLLRSDGEELNLIGLVPSISCYSNREVVHLRCLQSHRNLKGIAQLNRCAGDRSVGIVNCISCKGYILSYRYVLENNDLVNHLKARSLS